MDLRDVAPPVGVRVRVKVRVVDLRDLAPRFEEDHEA